MNKLLKYGMSGLVGLTLASPAFAASGFGTPNTTSGVHWQNQFQGETGTGNNNDTYAQRYGQNGNYGENGGQWDRGQRYGQNGYNGNQDQEYGNNSAGGSQAVTQGFVAHLQRRLQQQGFYHQGNVDGVWGPETQSALENFQQQNNLRPTGQIDMRTLEALNMMNGGNNGQYGSNSDNYGQNQNYGESQRYGSYGQNGGNYGQNGRQYSQSGNEGYNTGSNGNPGAYGNNNRDPNWYGSSGGTNMGNSGTGGGSGNR